VSGFRYRLIDLAGGEIGIVADLRPFVAEDVHISLPDGSHAVVVEVYDDEEGQEGGVRATLVVEET
jgi:hypothetical protein